MGERDEERNLGNRVTEDMPIWEEMIIATSSNNPKESVERVLVNYKTEPYYRDAIKKAKIMLAIKECYRRKLL